jgi:methionine-rich copper-binding protein CopC
MSWLKKSLCLLPLVLLVLVFGSGTVEGGVLTISSDPSNSATNVAPNTNITVHFSEAVQSSFTFTVKKKVNNNYVIVSGNPTLAQDGMTAAFVPNGYLDSNINYSVSITAKAKVGGNQCNKCNFSFTTGAFPPVVVAQRPRVERLSGLLKTSLPQFILMYTADNETGVDNIYGITDGGQEKQLTQNSSNSNYFYGLSYSRQGAKLAYAYRPYWQSYPNYYPTTISVLDLNQKQSTGQYRTYEYRTPGFSSPGYSIYAPALSPDGNWIAYAIQWNPMQTTKPANPPSFTPDGWIVEGPVPPGELGVVVSQDTARYGGRIPIRINDVFWSNMKYANEIVREAIVFSRDEVKGSEPYTPGKYIYVHFPEEGVTDRVVRHDKPSNQIQGYAPVLNTDGTKLAFVRNEDDQDQMYMCDVTVKSSYVDCANLQRIQASGGPSGQCGQSYSDNAPHWSGNILYFLSNRTCVWEIFKADSVNGPQSLIDTDNGVDVKYIAPPR